MESYIIKIYPHKYMDRVQQNHFAADNIAHTISRVIKLMLDDWSYIKYKDLSSNEGYEYEIHNPFDATHVRTQIELIFPEVSFIKTWIDHLQPERIKLTGIDRNFQEDEMNSLIII